MKPCAWGRGSRTGKAEGAGPAFSEEAYLGLPKTESRAEPRASLGFACMVSRPLRSRKSRPHTMTFHHCHLHHSAPHDLSVPCLLCSLAQPHLLHIGDYLEAPKQAVCVISHSLPLHAQFPVPDMLPDPVLVDLALPACSGRFNYSLPSRNPLLTLLLP